MVIVELLVIIIYNLLSGEFLISLCQTPRSNIILPPPPSPTPATVELMLANQLGGVSLGQSQH